jgi:DNA-binding NtrC family response regulator
MTKRLRQSILILEDDETLLTLYGKVLHRADYDVSSTATIDEATRLLVKKHFDLLVTDLSVAGGSNVFEFVSSVRMSRPEILVLIVTGYSPDNISAEATRLGLQVMEKPFTPDDLVSRVSRLLAAKAA